MSESNKSIVVDGVTKTFGKVTALDNVSMRAVEGKVTGLLGPNGAGKSTLIKVMTTLLLPNAGQVMLEGIDVIKQPSEAREKLGLAGQFAAVDGFLTGRETLEMVGRLYHIPKPEAKNRAEELLKKLDLVDAADRQIKTYSGGMRRRLDLGASLVARPNILFLDEPTTGLDPRTRLQLWDIIRELVADGVSIVLTTQYLEEADALADYIYIIDHGKMIAEGTAEQLKSRLGKDIIEIKVADTQITKSEKLLKDKFKSGGVETDDLTRRIRIKTDNGSEDLLDVAQTLKRAKIKPEELSLHRPSLDDVFLELTGRKAEDEERN